MHAPAEGGDSTVGMESATLKVEGDAVLRRRIRQRWKVWELP